jgi:DNA-binding GntR family transcriptional regulator
VERVYTFDALEPAKDDNAPQSERLYELLSNAIISGEIAPGASMTEPGLAQRYGVSRAPLREALRRLEERQLIERSAYRGMRVVELSPRMVEELYEIREALEGLACRRAASRVGDPEATLLRDALASERAYIRYRVGGGEADSSAPKVSSVHSVIARIADNRELLDLLDGAIWRLLRAEYWRRIKRPNELRQSYLEHAGIVRALIHRDGELACLLMHRHIRKTFERRR